MFNERTYLPSDYINHDDLNTLVSDCTELTNIYSDIFGDDSWIETMNTFTINGFPYLQWIASIENNIKYIGDNFYKPDGYIENRDWLENEINSYQTFSYEDINRMIIDMRLLYNVREEQVTIWNGQTFVNWEIESDLEWEEY